MMISIQEEEDVENTNDDNQYNDNNNNQEWAGWRGGGEEGSKSLPPVPSLQGEDLWAFWDQVGTMVIALL